MSQQNNPPPRVRLGHGGGMRLTGESARDSRRTIRRLFHYARPYTGRLAGVALLVVVSTAAGLAGPILLGRAIDQHVIPKDLPGLAQIALTMLVVYLLASARAADAVPAAQRGPLHGLPIAVKDLVNVSGIVTSQGSPIFRDAVAGAELILMCYQPITAREYRSRTAAKYTKPSRVGINVISDTHF